MKAILQVSFGNLSQGFARLEIDLPFAPSCEIGFEHPVWHDPRKPKEISYNMENAEFFVEFATEKLESHTHGMYESHGWTVHKA